MKSFLVDISVNRAECVSKDANTPRVDGLDSSIQCGTVHVRAIFSCSFVQKSAELGGKSFWNLTASSLSLIHI